MCRHLCQTLNLLEYDRITVSSTRDTGGCNRYRFCFYLFLVSHILTTDIPRLHIYDRLFVPYGYYFPMATHSYSYLFIVLCTNLPQLLPCIRLRVSLPLPLLFFFITYLFIIVVILFTTEPSFCGR